MKPDVARLWLPPASDHADWQLLTGDMMSRDQYVAKIDEAARAFAARGITVEVVEFLVSEMRQRLEEEGLANTTQNRATIIASNGISIRRRLGLKIDRNVVGWCLIEPSTVIATAVSPTLAGVLTKLDQ